MLQDSLQSAMRRLSLSSMHRLTEAGEIGVSKGGRNQRTKQASSSCFPSTIKSRRGMQESSKPDEQHQLDTCSASPDPFPQVGRIGSDDATEQSCCGCSKSSQEDDDFCARQGLRLTCRPILSRDEGEDNRLDWQDIFERSTPFDKHDDCCYCQFSDPDHHKNAVSSKKVHGRVVELETGGYVELIRKHRIY